MFMLPICCVTVWLVVLTLIGPYSVCMTEIFNYSLGKELYNTVKVLLLLSALTG